MAGRIKRRLRFTRNLEFAWLHIMNRNTTVNTDSVAGHPAGTCLLRMIRIRNTTDTMIAHVEWECRETWTMRAETAGIDFQIYQARSHKYWLRRLIRRCR